MGWTIQYWTGSTWVTLAGAVDKIIQELNGHEEATFVIANNETNRNIVASDRKVKILYDSTVQFKGLLTAPQYDSKFITCLCYDECYVKMNAKDFTGSYTSAAANTILSAICTAAGVVAGSCPTTAVSVRFRRAICWDAATFLARALNADFWMDEDASGNPRFNIGTRGTSKGSITPISWPVRGIDRSKKRDKVIIRGVDSDGNEIEGSAGTGSNIAVFTEKKASDVATLNSLAAKKLAELNKESSGVKLPVVISTAYNLFPGDTVTLNNSTLNLVGTFRIWKITKTVSKADVEVDRPQSVTEQAIQETESLEEIGIYPAVAPEATQNTSVGSSHTNPTVIASAHTTNTVIADGHTTAVSIASDHATITVIADGHTTTVSIASAHGTATVIADDHTTTTAIQDAHTYAVIIASDHSTTAVIASTHSTTTVVASDHSTTATIASAHSTATVVADAHSTTTVIASEHGTVTVIASAHGTSVAVQSAHSTAAEIAGAGSQILSFDYTSFSNVYIPHETFGTIVTHTVPTYSDAVEGGRIYLRITQYSGGPCDAAYRVKLGADIIEQGWLKDFFSSQVWRYQILKRFPVSENLSGQTITLEMAKTGYDTRVSGALGSYTARKHTHGLTTQPAGHPVTTQPSGHTVSTQPSGHTVSTQPSGHPVSTQPSGHTVSTQPSGHPVTTQPSGHSVQTQPSGHTVTQQPSGHPVSTQPSGHPVSTQPSGHTVLTQPSGHTVSQQPSGHTVSTQPSGHTVSTQPSGHTVSQQPSGHSVTNPSHKHV